MPVWSIKEGVGNFFLRNPLKQDRSLSQNWWRIWEQFKGSSGSGCLMRLPLGWQLTPGVWACLGQRVCVQGAFSQDGWQCQHRWGCWGVFYSRSTAIGFLQNETQENKRRPWNSFHHSCPALFVRSEARWTSHCICMKCPQEAKL